MGEKKQELPDGVTKTTLMSDTKTISRGKKAKN